jgi:two-component system, chemotaxis family, response regulator PixG
LKHFEFLRNLRNLQFSGQLLRTNTQGQQWLFYFVRGSLVHATGGIHPVRRWRRNLAICCPQKVDDYSTWADQISRLNSEALSLGWDYALLSEWVSRQEITPEQAINIIHTNISDLLFDLAYAGSTTDQIRQNSTLLPYLGSVRLEKVTAQTHSRWQTWQQANLEAYSPNSIPVLKQPYLLRQMGSEQSYQTLVALLNGQHTLYELAVQRQRSIVEVTTSLVPLIRSRIVELIQGSDLPSPLPQTASPFLALPPSRKTLIACVDDSFLVRHMMERLLTSAGHEFLGIEDAVRAIGILLARKPDLIFLDLVMPKTNGHEVCQQLRKMSCFCHTPIVILTGSDGFANRLRSSVVGASDFLSKPLDAEAVLNVIHKHLDQPSQSSALVPSSRFSASFPRDR